MKLSFSGKKVCENCGHGILKHPIGGFDKPDTCPEPHPEWASMVRHYKVLEENLRCGEKALLLFSEYKALPCGCSIDGDSVKWNPYNGVVQCHKCGQIYTPNKNE